MLTASVVACDDARDGSTICGQGEFQRTCFANSYCSSQANGVCTDGCLTDLNCREGDVCKKLTEVSEKKQCWSASTTNALADATNGADVSGPHTQQCVAACTDAAGDACDASGAALSQAELATCSSKCGTKTAAEVATITSCWDQVAYQNQCERNAARACFAPVL